MIKYLPYEEKYQDQMYDVFNELTKEKLIENIKNEGIIIYKG